MLRRVEQEDQRGTGGDLWALGVLPVLAAGALAGFLGIYWDIAWHIDKGRDTFFTPPHNFIYTNLAIVLAASVYGMWRDRRETPFHLPVGAYRFQAGILIVAVGAALVLVFAPLDDLWHRLFGVDVTLWGPMHLVGILGLGLARFGSIVCAWLDRELTADPGRRRLLGDVSLFFAIVLLGGSVLAVAEYEFMVPQYPMFWHPILLAGLPVFTLVLAARLAPRPWAATLVALGFTVLRLALAAWLIGASWLDLAGVSRPTIPLLIPAGVAVDVLVARGAPGWGVGLAAGAVTLAVNGLLIDASAPVRGGIQLFWTSAVLARAVVPALLLSALLGAAGAAAADALRARRRAPEGEAFGRGSRRAGPGIGRLAGAAVLAAVVVAGLSALMTPPTGAPSALASTSAAAARVTADVSVRHRGPGRPSTVTVRVHPSDAARDGELLLSMYERDAGVMNRRVINRRVLTPIARGVYRTEFVFPAGGRWGYYMRFGPGQAGYATGGIVELTPEAAIADSFTAVFRSGLRRAPVYVQPLGYAAFGLLAALSLAGVWAVLTWLSNGRMSRLAA